MELVNWTGKVLKKGGKSGQMTELCPRRGREGKMMGWEMGTGFQRQGRDCEKACGIQGTESCKEEGMEKAAL